MSPDRNQAFPMPQFATTSSGISARTQLPVFTQEETIVLRALVAGKNKKHICTHLRMDARLPPPQTITGNFSTTGTFV